VYGSTWIGVACWWYLPSHVNQLDVLMLQVQITSGSPVVGLVPTIDTWLRSMWEVPLEGSHTTLTVNRSFIVGKLKHLAV
jgi:hypothetical protein